MVFWFIFRFLGYFSIFKVSGVFYLLLKFRGYFAHFIGFRGILDIF